MSRHVCRSILLQQQRSSSSHSKLDQLRTTLQPRFKTFQTHLSSRSRHVVTTLAQQATVLGLKLNEVTGYEQVERLKSLVTDQELALTTARTAAREAKTAYEQAVAHRSNAQREVNSLLERKHSWTDADVSAFTTLVRTDHASTSAVTATSALLQEKERAVDKAFTDLTSAILQRYHEEQVWSDKIRSVSTWANIVGLVFNFLIFVVAIAIVEPWKRRRLVERVEERITGLVERLEAKVEDMSMRLTPDEPLSPATPPTSSPPPLVPTPPSFFEEPLAASRHLLVRIQRLWRHEESLSTRDTQILAAVSGAVVGIVTWTIGTLLFKT